MFSIKSVLIALISVIQVDYEFWRDTFNFHFGHSSGKKIYFEKFGPFHNSSFIIAQWVPIKVPANIRTTKAKVKGFRKIF